MRRIVLVLAVLVCASTAHADPTVHKPTPGPVGEFSPYWEVYQSGRELEYPDWGREADFYTVMERFPTYEQAHAAMVLLTIKHPNWSVDLIHIYGPERGQWDFLEYWRFCPDDHDVAPVLERQIWFTNWREHCYDTDGGCGAGDPRSTAIHEHHAFRGRRP